MNDEVKLTVRLPADVHEGLVELARKEHRSMNQQIVYSVSQSISHSIDGNRVADRLAAIEVTLRNVVKIVTARLEFNLESNSNKVAVEDTEGA